jgi:phospholipid transport system substrate-binding protein
MRKLLIALAVVVLFQAPPASAAGQPAEVIQTFHDHLLAMMRKAKQLGFKGRVAELGPAVDKAFDLPEMTRLTLGTAARTLPPEQLAQLTQAFRSYTIASYAANFDNFGGERFEMGAVRPQANGSVVVPSKLIPGDGSQPVVLDYVMREEGGRWGITDVLMEGAVSQVAWRRSEFVSVLRRDGFPRLLETIEKKTEALAASKG